MTKYVKINYQILEMKNYIMEILLNFNILSSKDCSYTFSLSDVGVLIRVPKCDLKVS